MNSSRESAGRGRGRPRTNVVDSPPSEVSALVTPDVNIASTPHVVQSCVTSQTTVDKSSVGRGAHLRRKVEVPDPHWKVSELTIHQFKSNVRPSKPRELGTIGQQIQVMVNYFPVREFPQKGLVYQYHVQIENKRNSDISRTQRRAIYESWLKRFRDEHPQINRYKIAFDNQKTVITYDEPLPDINEVGISQTIMGPNRANRQVEYQFSIKQVGNPIDLRSLCSLEGMYEPKSINNIEPNELQNIKQVLSIALHEHCSSRADYIYNRTFFTHPNLENEHGYWDLGLGTAAWRGFYSCLVFTKGTHQLLMNLDVSHAVFTKKQPFLDFLCEVMLHSPCGKWYYGPTPKVQKVEMRDVLKYLDRNTNSDYYAGELEFLVKHCKYLTVRSKVVNKTIGYTIHGLGEPASTHTFEWNLKNNQLVTIENYYKERYGIELKYPSLPTLEMQKKSFVPMEFVDIEPVKIKKITDEQRALLCLKSSMDPVPYCRAINEVRKNPKQQCFEDDPFISAWNLNVDVKQITVPARILPMPDIIYTDKHRVTGNYCRPQGVWNNKKTQFHRPTTFPSVWAMINLSSSLDIESCIAFYNDLSSVAAQRGINCREPEIFEEYNVQTHSINKIIAALKQMMERNTDCKFFIVILPEDPTIIDRIYGEIKKLCELESGLGIVTQMIKATTVKNRRGNNGQYDYSTLNNILLKINTKLNGINSILHVPDDIGRFFECSHRIMYVGVDLSHGAPGLNRGRSTVAVVASADNIPNRYFKEIYMQERPSDARGESWEYVVDMKQIMKSLISRYDEHQGYPPKAIVIYRDGISTSEFDTVFKEELTAIREACVELSPVYVPCLTYIVVNKKHHTRVFSTDSTDNVVAGTVVDSHDVTNPATYDFFLNSHHGQLGTSRPTHYHVLYDDNKLKPDEVQMLTYALCYTSARCTRSISIPAPVKYADLLAFRANFYININDQQNAQSTDSEQAIPINKTVDIKNTIKSKRIVLSEKLAKDCPFFL